MKRGLSQKGFTIVETMIFLGVSSGILIGALTLVSGMQNKTAFRNAVNDFDQQLTAISTNVANGYYPRADNASCTPGSDSVSVVALADAALGTQQECIYVGRIAKFQENKDTFQVYNIVGRRQSQAVGGVKREVTNLDESYATVITGAAMPPQEIRLQNGSHVIGIRVPNPTGVDIGAFGFLTTFNSYDADQLKSGSLRTDFFGLESSNLSAVYDENTMASGFKSKRASLGNFNNPKEGIEICLKSGSSNQVALVVLGGSNKVATTSFTILEKDGCW